MTSKDWKWLTGLIVSVGLTAVVTHFTALGKVEDDYHAVELRLASIEARLDATGMLVIGANGFGPAVPDTMGGQP
ncbi:MAG: hypothetical protein JSU72_15775 [Deltaproteobacteria bacterium]|nr:MAG: hypothetical protein JSU72_15775 [Deltaproteobacteria bacterium]